MTLVELSHRISDGDTGYPGLPAPRVRPHLTHAASAGRYADDATFEITHLSLVGNSGTYLDSPAHRFPGRADVADVPLAQLVDLPALVVDTRIGGSNPIAFEVTPEMTGAAVLVRTGWDTRRGAHTYFDPAPYLSSRTAEHLANVLPALVGVDVWNVDDTRHTARPVHTILLDAGIVIVEHLRGLSELPPTGARFSAVPLAVVGAASMPVRAWAALASETAAG
jgi:arylformamidase